MEGGNPNELFDGVPIPLWLLENEWQDAIIESWDAGSNADERDFEGRGWLHRAIMLQVPSWLAMEGFRRLDKTWWHPDKQGYTPFIFLSLTRV